MATATATKPAPTTPPSYLEQEEAMVLALEKEIRTSKAAIRRAQKKVYDEQKKVADAIGLLSRLRPEHPVLNLTGKPTKIVKTQVVKVVKASKLKLNDVTSRGSEGVLSLKKYVEKGGWIVVVGAAIGLIAAFLYLPVYSDSVHYKDSQNWLVPYMPIAIFVIIALGILIGSVLGYLLMKPFTKQFPKKNEEHSVNPDAKQ